jgi:hypothetical protein
MIICQRYSRILDSNTTGRRSKRSAAKEVLITVQLNTVHRGLRNAPRQQCLRGAKSLSTDRRRTSATIAPVEAILAAGFSHLGEEHEVILDRRRLAQIEVLEVF